jgi:hypothetical protein
MSFKDPFSDPDLLEPSGEELLARALWKLGAELGFNTESDVVLTGVVVCAEYQHVGAGPSGFEYRTFVRKPGGVLPYWHARGLVETLRDYVKDKLPGEQRAAMRQNTDDEG